MNFNNTELFFGAKYVVYGKQSPQETNKAYGEKIKQLKFNRATATETQAYLKTPKMQEKIAMLPSDSFVRLHTGILQNGKKKDEFLNFTPFISFETRRINDQLQLEKSCGDDCDTLKLSLDENGCLDKKAINAWFDKLIDYYA